MKTLNKLGKLLLMAFAVFFYGCDEEIVTSELILDDSKTAIIEVSLLAELDNKSLGLEKAPNGTKVAFSIDYSQFNSKATTGKWTQIAVVNDGMVSVEVPVSSYGANVQLDFEPFVFKQVQPYNSSTETKNILYQANSLTISALADLKYVRQVTYSPSEFGDNSVTVNKTFKLEYISGALESSTDVPAGTQIRMYTNSWTATAEVSEAGKLTAAVPFNATVYFEFIAPYEIDEDTKENRKFTSFSTIDSEKWNVAIINLYFGRGQTWQ
jgi:hypothetical protein